MTRKLSAEEKEQAKRLSALSSAKLSERKAQLERELAKVQLAEQSKKRKNDDRKKILVGAWCLKRASEDAAYNAKMLKALDLYLVRDDDRALFGLAAKSTATEKAVEGVSSSPEDQLAAAQKMTATSADHGDPSKVVGRDRQEGPKNAPEAPKVVPSEGKPEKKKWGVF